MDTINLPGNQPATNPDGPDRIALVTLAARRGTSSPALSRIVAGGRAQRGPGQVPGSFQSCV